MCDSNMMGTGGLIRSSKGDWITGFSCFEGGGMLAELLAVRRGLQLAWESGFRNVVLEIDSQEVVSLLQKRK